VVRSEAIVPAAELGAPDGGETVEDVVEPEQAAERGAIHLPQKQHHRGRGMRQALDEADDVAGADAVFQLINRTSSVAVAVDSGRLTTGGRRFRAIEPASRDRRRSMD
jgi:hypothetical protein